MLGFTIDMSIEKTKIINTYNYSSNRAFKNFNHNLEPFYNNNEEKKSFDKSLKLKFGVLSAAIISTIAVLYGITKNRGQNPLKNYNIFKQEISPMNMLQITGVSVTAALFTGIALDKKENAKPKVKEAISQMVGNLLIPILMVNESIKLKDFIDKKPSSNMILKGLKNTHKAIYTTVALLTGLFIGNKVANNINHNIFPCHCKRPIKPQDFSAHFDDVCFATSLIFKDNKLGQYASRIIPATLLVSAYETGTKTIHDKN